MTGPIDWNALYGVGSPNYNAQLQAFNSQRDTFYNQMVSTMAQRNPGTAPASYQQPMTPVAVQMQGAAAGANAGWTDEDLVGAATFWGIPENAARSMPREQLVGIVNDLRTKARPDESTLLGKVGAEAAMLAAVPAMVAVGAGEAITGGLQRLPIVGESLGRFKLVHDADLKLRQMEEGIRASTPESFQWVNSGANVTGNLAATYFPATAAFGLAGKVLGAEAVWASAMGKSAGPIARLASQGAFSGIALAGAGVGDVYTKAVTGHAADVDTQQALHAMGVVGASAMLPVAWEQLAPVATKLATRVMNSFGIGEVMMPKDLRGTARRFDPEQFSATGPGDNISQLRAMAANGDEQASAFLDFMGGRGSMEIPANVHNEPPTGIARPLAGILEETAPGAPNREEILGGMRRVAADPAFWQRQTGLAIEQAENVAAQMNKAGTIIQSPAFPEIAGQATITENSVAHAALSDNPGGSNLVQGISDPASFVSNLGANVRFAQRGTRLDAMVSDLPITDAMVGEYETFGMYTGQRVLTPEGIGGRVTQIKGNYATVEPIYNGASRSVRIEDLHPWTSSPAATEVPQLWDAFKTYSDQRILATADAMGGAMTPEQLTAVRHQNLPQYMQDFFAEAGIEHPADQARLRSYFNVRFVEDFTNLVPAEAAMQQAAVAHYNSVEAAAPPLPVVQDLDQAAVAKGFIAIPQGETGGVNLRKMPSASTTPSWVTQNMDVYYQQAQAAGIVSDIDTLARQGLTARQISDTLGERVPGKDIIERGNVIRTVRNRHGIPSQDDIRAGEVMPEIAFESHAAAKEFVRNVNVDPIDVTPATDVPMEVSAMHPREPVQGPNLNEGTPPRLAESIEEMAADSEGGAGGPPVAEAIAKGNFGRAKNLWTDGFLKWRPARRFFSSIDQALHEAGTPTGISADYDLLANKLTQHHNNMHPYMDELTDIFSPSRLSGGVKTQHLVDATWTRLYEMTDLAARNARAADAGINPKTFDQFEQLMLKLFPETGLDEIRQIPRYISHIAKRQSDPEMIGKAFDGFELGPTTRPFYEYARTGNMNMREMDPRTLGETYIRAVFWKRDMAEPFNAILDKWKGLAETSELAPAAQVMENWMKIIRYGYHAEDDFALDTMHGALRIALGPEITRQQARELFNFGLNATHSGLLGFRLNVMARDALQLFFAIPRAGTDLARVMARYATSAEARQALWDDALNAGAIALQSPRMAAPGTFAGEMERLGSTGLEGIQAAANNPTVSRRMWATAKVTNAVRDLMPAVLKDARDTALHPMYLYGKQSELMRALVYTAGKEKANAAIEAFRAAGPAGDLAELMGASGARTFDPSWQRQFQQLVAAGDDAGAANFLGRQLADATQFKYGNLESPYVGKSITGKVALQFGNYSMQYFQYVRESLANGSISDKAKFLAMAGATTAGLEAASRATGWNFRLMNPYFGLGFTGGPWLGVATGVAAGVQQASQVLMGREPDPSKMLTMWNSLGQAGSMMNPVAGLYQTGTGLAHAIQDSPYPGQAVGRMLITGSHDNAPDINQFLMPQAQQSFQNSLQPMSGPVRASGYGTMQIPQQPVTDPAAIQDSPYQSGQPSQVPLPGGQPYSYRPNPASQPPNTQFPGVTDPSRVYQKGGQMVYDTPNSIGGHVPTHALSGAGSVLQPGETWEQAEQRVTGQQYTGAPPVVRDINALDPDTRNRVAGLMSLAQTQGVNLSIGETARSQARQNYLFAQGRSPQMPGQPVTWTLTSDHGRGRAIDFIVNGDSTGRDPAYQWLWETAKKFGLVPMGQMDPGHLAVTDSSRAAVPYPSSTQAGGNPNPGGGAFF